MGNKLVFRFEAAGPSNGLFVERVMLRTERGLREIRPRQSRPIERGTQWREAGRTGFELNDQEDLPGRGGPLVVVIVEVGRRALLTGS